jgi:tRNA (guanine-N7-)-methyltransferase
MLDPNDFIITRKRKKYKFARFANSPLCFEHAEWPKTQADILEIGAGTGLLSVAMAERSPEEQVVAVDVKADRLITGANAATEKKLSNIRFLRTRADLLPELFTPHSVNAIWVTFPDPFPKKRSQGRRLTHPTYLKIFAQLLKSDGALYFKTDAHDLFDWSIEQLVQTGWHIEKLSFDLHESTLPSEYKVETTYEARFRAEDIRINFLKALPPIKANA